MGDLDKGNPEDKQAPGKGLESIVKHIIDEEIFPEPKTRWNKARQGKQRQSSRVV